MEKGEKNKILIILAIFHLFSHFLRNSPSDWAILEQFQYLSIEQYPTENTKHLVLLINKKGNEFFVCLFVLFCFHSFCCVLFSLVQGTLQTLNATDNNVSISRCKNIGSPP